MDLDVAQVRAFVRAAEELHFGRAAETLGISQQALSKRIAWLESLLRAPLFLRDGRGVSLTGAGRRFLGPARRTLEAADAAVASVTGVERPLRVDVWGHLYAPTRTLAQVAFPSGKLTLGHGRDLASVTGAFLAGDVDVAFGRVHPPLRAGLTHRLVRLEPVDAVLSADHPLAAEPALRPEQLSDGVLWAPGALERLDFLHRFADRFGVRGRAASVNLGLAHFLAGIAEDPRRFSLLPADVPLPPLRTSGRPHPALPTPGPCCGAPATNTPACPASPPPAPPRRDGADGWSTTPPATGFRNRRRRSPRGTPRRPAPDRPRRTMTVERDVRTTFSFH